MPCLRLAQPAGALGLGGLTVYACSREHLKLVSRNSLSATLGRSRSPIRLLEQHVCSDTEYNEDEDIMVYRVGC